VVALVGRLEWLLRVYVGFLTLTLTVRHRFVLRLFCMIHLCFNDRSVLLGIFGKRNTDVETSVSVLLNIGYRFGFCGISIRE